MPARRTSRADALLIAALADRGVNVTDTKLERWRQAGWQPPNDQRWGADGQSGSSSAYRPDAINQAAALATIVRPGRRRYEVALSVWGSGLWVREDTLRKAFRSALEGKSEYALLATANEPRHAPARERLRDRLGGDDGALDRYLTETAQVLLSGELPATADGLLSLMRAFSLEVDLDELARLAKGWRLGGLRELAETAPLDELRQARDYAVTLSAAHPEVYGPEPEPVTVALASLGYSLQRRRDFPDIEWGDIRDSGPDVLADAAS